MCENCSRRSFLGASAASGLLMAAGGLTARSEPPPKAARSKARICTLLGIPGPADRGWNLSQDEFLEIKAHLDEVEKKLGNVEFVVGRPQNAAEAAALMEAAGEDAPVLAISSGIGRLLAIMDPVLESGRPTAVFSAPASGHDWMYPPRWQSEGHRVTLFATSDYSELERAARLLRVMPLMRQSRALLFPPAQGTEPCCSPEQSKERLGAEMVGIGQDRFDAMLDEVDEEAVEALTARWIEGALDILEPTREDVVKAARVELALDRLIEEEQADAVAVGTCMGWLPRGFPCLAFTHLRDRGIPAVCEGDMDSLWTMLLFQYAFDIPGFQGNNYFDTSKNSLWIAHCTGPLKMDGADGPEAPYLLRGHSEVGGDGVVPEAHYRIGQQITRAKLINLDTILVSGGKIVEVPERSIRACRTQVRTEVEDAEKMVFDWGGGVLDGGMMTLLHRVLFYGDLVQDVHHLGHLMGMKVIEEG